MQHTSMLGFVGWVVVPGGNDAVNPVLWSMCFPAGDPSRARQPFLYPLAFIAQQRDELGEVSNS